MSRSFNFKRVVSILLFSTLFVTTTNAQTSKRWIVKSGYTGTSMDTLASIKAAVSGAGQSDTVIVLDGTYKEKISFSRWASQALKVNFSSNLPTAGVVVDVKTTRDSDNTVISSSSVSSTAAITSASIDSLKPGVLCTATIIVTSCIFHAK